MEALSELLRLGASETRQKTNLLPFLWWERLDSGEIDMATIDGGLDLMATLAERKGERPRSRRQSVGLMVDLAGVDDITSMLEVLRSELGGLPKGILSRLDSMESNRESVDLKPVLDAVASLKREIRNFVRAVEGLRFLRASQRTFRQPGRLT